MGPAITYWSIDERDYIAKLSIERFASNSFIPKIRTQSCFLGKETDTEYDHDAELPILGSKINVHIPVVDSPLVTDASFILTLNPEVTISQSAGQNICDLAGIKITECTWKSDSWEKIYNVGLTSKTNCFIVKKVALSNIITLRPILQVP